MQHRRRLSQQCESQIAVTAPLVEFIEQNTVHAFQ